MFFYNVYQYNASFTWIGKIFMIIIFYNAYSSFYLQIKTMEYVVLLIYRNLVNSAILFFAQGQHQYTIKQNKYFPYLDAMHMKKMLNNLLNLSNSHLINPLETRSNLISPMRETSICPKRMIKKDFK